MPITQDRHLDILNCAKHYRDALLELCSLVQEYYTYHEQGNTAAFSILTSQATPEGLIKDFTETEVKFRIDYEQTTRNYKRNTRAKMEARVRRNPNLKYEE